MSLHDYILAQGPQGNNSPNSTNFYLGDNEVIPDIFQQITQHLSKHSLYLLELASRNLCGFIGNLPSQPQQNYYDSEEEFDGYDTIDELYNDDHLDYYGEQEFDDDFEIPDY